MLLFTLGGLLPLVTDTRDSVLFSRVVGLSLQKVEPDTLRLDPARSGRAAPTSREPPNSLPVSWELRRLLVSLASPPREAAGYGAR